ncbi:hypothetical protein QFZ37_000078 [Chryseobacterium ginsenosidimutans]|uniref:hypothetical protein n=1 Tax=Chryseobacterium ginsenosidimutans TaxID=687846 RepID=UPI00278B7FDB|nr:hypothetical protein [Chryseobacterium ginsenosidimutans]MDQ0591709.1 hypothetical protein [Chryseobacterium ginsenosidimutans]
MKTKTTLNGETLELASIPNTMTCNFIQTLVNNYRQNHMVSINNNLGIQDAHSIHFDLATLKKFISDIEIETKKSNPTITDKDLGIRFYYAAYPKAADWSIMANTPIGIGYAEKHTLVMVPTMKMEDETGELLSYDFNPLSTSGKGEFLAMATNKTSDPNEESLAQNHGNLIPPDSTKTESF